MARNYIGLTVEWPKYEPPKLDCKDFILSDWALTRTRLGIPCRPNPTTFNYKKVIFNDPATIVFWEDGTKTVVKCAKEDAFDPIKGLAIAFMKHALGDGNKHNKVIREEIGNYISKYVFLSKDDLDFV